MKNNELATSTVIPAPSNPHAATEYLEPFVDADIAAGFLSLTPRHLLELTRSGLLPGYPLGSGTRRIWRFRLSEVAASVQASAKQEAVVAVDADPSYPSKPRQRAARRSLRRDKVSKGLAPDRAA